MGPILGSSNGQQGRPLVLTHVICMLNKAFMFVPSLPRAPFRGRCNRCGRITLLHMKMQIPSSQTHPPKCATTMSYCRLILHAIRLLLMRKSVMLAINAH